MHQRIFKNRIVSMLFVIFFVVSSLFRYGDLTIFANGREFQVKSTNVNVRSGAGTNFPSLGKVTLGYKINVLGSEQDSDGKVWYKFNYNNRVGYIREDFIRSTSSNYVLDAEFELELSGQGFPEDYKQLLRQLHADHPNWKFIMQKINMDFDYAIDNEMLGTRTLVNANSISSYKSIEQGKYDYTTSTWPSFDGSAWVAASREITAYYMDPRNFLYDPYVFQFEVQTFDSRYHTLSGVLEMVKGTFLDDKINTQFISQANDNSLIIPIIDGDLNNYNGIDMSNIPNNIIDTGTQTNGPLDNTDVIPNVNTGKVPTSGDMYSGPGVIDYSKPIVPILKYKDVVFPLSNVIVAPSVTVQVPNSIDVNSSLSYNFNYLTPGEYTYSEIIYDACRQVGINPYVVVAMILQEQGVKGQSDLISGKNAKYPGVYNYGNVGAYASNGMTAVENGLKYAASEGRYNRPWNTKEKALYGVVDYYSSSFIKKGQDTFYLKKWDVLGNFSNQYMTNVSGAASEGQILGSSYDNNLINITHVFKIPYYKNMPEYPVQAPTKDGSPNNKLKNITVQGYQLTPTFNTDTTQYSVAVGADVNTIKVSVEPYDKKAKYSGDGNIKLTVTNTVIDIAVVAENGDIRNYTLNVFKPGVENVSLPNEELVIPIITYSPLSMIEPVNNNSNLNIGNESFVPPIVTGISVGPGE